jgi:hypothetical protein
MFADDPRPTVEENTARIGEIRKSLRGTELPTFREDLIKKAQSMADQYNITFYFRDSESPFIFQHPPGEPISPREGSGQNLLHGAQDTSRGVIDPTG